jgi:diaminopimelate decarboxylase
MNLELIKDRMAGFQTPFYAYDLGLLRSGIQACNNAKASNFHVHYAIKANTESKVLNTLSSQGFGADCVSYNEVDHALKNGFQADKIVFAGVGKSDYEIRMALRNRIYCFNVESLQEIGVINSIAEEEGTVAKIALRLNPNVKANTHKYITTGLDKNKFGIDSKDFDNAIETIKKSPFIAFEGIHFHIGSQITNLDNFKQLCLRVNQLFEYFEQRQLRCNIVNVGGGLGIDYENPVQNPYPDFKAFFDVYKQFLELPEDIEIHFELGRALVGNCGALITEVLYEKNNGGADFLIVDAGMTELMRPALYNAYHKIEKLEAVDNGQVQQYTVAGPICESSDVFSNDCPLPSTKRGDKLVILSAGAYGEVMRSRYNLRDGNQALFI